MTRTGARTALIACGAVARDTAALVTAHGWSADVHGISSDLHMTPLDSLPDLGVSYAPTEATR